MKKRGYVSIVMGVCLVLMGIYFCFVVKTAVVIPIVIGLALIYLGFSGTRRAMIIFGHSLIVIGAYLFTWGMYMLPNFKPTFSSIIFGPLFWSIISIMGGICANFHGFCHCVRNSGAKD